MHPSLTLTVVYVWSELNNGLEDYLLPPLDKVFACIMCIIVTVVHAEFNVSLKSLFMLDVVHFVRFISYSQCFGSYLYSHLQVVCCHCTDS